MPITIKRLIFEWDWEYIYETVDESGDKIFILAHTEEEFYQELKRFGYYDEYCEKQKEKTKLIVQDDNGQYRLF